MHSVIPRTLKFTCRQNSGFIRWQRIPWLVKKLFRLSRTVLHVAITSWISILYFYSVAVFCCLGSNIEQLKFVDAWKGHRSFMITMCHWTDTYTGHCLSSFFTAALYFGNSLQNMFYIHCPVFSTCVSYTKLHIFPLNFWSHLWSQTANQECRMSGVEKDNWYTMMKSIYTKWKLGGT